MIKIIRPEIKDGLARAVEYLANERTTEFNKSTPTQLINDLVFEEWERKHPGMMYPNSDGEVIPQECTPSPLIP